MTTWVFSSRRQRKAEKMEGSDALELAEQRKGNKRDFTEAFGGDGANAQNMDPVGVERGWAEDEFFEGALVRVLRRENRELRLKAEELSKEKNTLLEENKDLKDQVAKLRMEKMEPKKRTPVAPRPKPAPSGLHLTVKGASGATRPATFTVQTFGLNQDLLTPITGQNFGESEPPQEVTVEEGQRPLSANPRSTSQPLVAAVDKDNPSVVKRERD